MSKTEAAGKFRIIERQGVEPGMSPILTMLRAFQRQKISYCYWKSSRRIEAVLTGESDVDLLVAGADQHRAEIVLLQHGFKQFFSVAWRDHPSVSSFLGYDDKTGQIIHFHMHFRLIIGERLLKNYHIPWEAALLAAAIPHPTLPIRMLDPASEAVLLAVRACLELRRFDPVTLQSWQATTLKFALDRRDLVVGLDPAILRRRAAELTNNDLADMIADAIYGRQALDRQPRLRRSLQAYFAPYRTYNGLEARLRGAARALLWSAGRLNKRVLFWPRPWNRCAPGGGCVVALTGVDGSGKSTTGKAIRAWLGAEVDVVPIYFGTGDGRPSLLLWPLKLMVPMFERLLKTKPKGASHGNVSARPPGRMYSMFLIIWAMVVAREKRKKLLAARRGANRGMMVLTDRYPQDEIIGFNDGPLLSRLPAVPDWLRRREAASYALARRLPPDLVIKLVVTPETAARREPNMDPEVIRARIGELQRLGFAGARIVCVDAEQPAADVIRAVKQEIWRLL